MCMCMCMCMYVCVCVYIYIYIYIFICLFGFILEPYIGGRSSSPGQPVAIGLGSAPWNPLAAAMIATACVWNESRCEAAMLTSNNSNMAHWAHVDNCDQTSNCQYH